MQRSRRLLLVLSPAFLADKSFSLLECQLGLRLQRSHRAAIVTVVYRSVRKLPCAEVDQLRQAAATTIAWRGAQSQPRRSRFWLRLRLALPLRPLAMGRRLIDSTSSHSDLAVLALQGAQHVHNWRPDNGRGRKNGRAAANQRLRDRQAPSMGVGRRGGTFWKEGSRRCVGYCHGAGLTVATGMLQVSHDRITSNTKIEIAPSLDSTHSSINHAPTLGLVSAPPTFQQEADGAKRQQVIGSSTLKETQCQEGGGA